jgi:hypothetical protein
MRKTVPATLGLALVGVVLAAIGVAFTLAGRPAAGLKIVVGGLGTTALALVATSLAYRIEGVDAR